MTLTKKIGISPQFSLVFGLVSVFRFSVTDITTAYTGKRAWWSSMLFEKFFYYLDGRHFILTSDHRQQRSRIPSYLLQATTEPKCSSRLVRDALRLLVLDSEFEVRHRPGPEIPHVDGLSRFSWRAMKEGQSQKVTVVIDLDSCTRSVCTVIEMGIKPLSAEELRAEQLKDEQLEPIIRFNAYTNVSHA